MRFRAAVACPLTGHITTARAPAPRGRSSAWRAEGPSRLAARHPVHVARWGRVRAATRAALGWSGALGTHPLERRPVSHARHLSPPLLSLAPPLPTPLPLSFPTPSPPVRFAPHPTLAVGLVVTRLSRPPFFTTMGKSSKARAGASPWTAFPPPPRSGAALEVAAAPSSALPPQPPLEPLLVSARWLSAVGRAGERPYNKCPVMPSWVPVATKLFPLVAEGSVGGEGGGFHSARGQGECPFRAHA